MVSAIQQHKSAIYIHIYIYTHIYTYIYTHTHIYIYIYISSVQFSRSVVSNSSWPHELQQARLSITNSRSSPRLTSIESVMPSSHLILCHPIVLLPPIPPSIRVFSNESTLYMRWPKYWSFSFSIIPSKEIPGLIYIYISPPSWHLCILKSPSKEFYTDLWLQFWIVICLNTSSLITSWMTKLLFSRVTSYPSL